MILNTVTQYIAANFEQVVALFAVLIAFSALRVTMKGGL
jgi:hypothetical protein